MGEDFNRRLYINTLRYHSLTQEISTCRTTLVDQISINILILYINYTLIINVLPVENMKWERITACDIIVLTQEISSTGPH
jgi:hypothetical protein